MGVDFVVWFQDIGRLSTSVVGGKSANLAEMRRIGIPVPDGFAVTAEAYNRFLIETGAAEEINRYLKSMSLSSTRISDYEKGSQFIRDIIESQDMPEAISHAIITCYLVLCDKHGGGDLAVAVRSSGVAEDLSDSSFAGQYESFLNVRGRDELVEKIRKCWSSQFTVRAIAYRQKKGLPAEGSAMGVTVLKMVCARSAGVGFTAHPITGDQSKIVLEGNWGLGESIVQGLVNPDRYVIDKESMQLTKRTISDKERLLRYGNQGIVEDDVPMEKRRIPCLSDEEAIKLAEYAKILEAHYGSPQDTEWAVDPNLTFPENLFLVQTRPITVSRKENDEGEKADYLVDLMIQMVRQISDSEKRPFPQTDSQKKEGA